WMTGAIFVVGVCSWYLLRGRNERMARQSLKIGAIVGLVATGIVMLTGDRSGVEVAKHQPMKLAAAEGLMDGSTRAPFSIVPGVEVPGVLSILATHDLDGYVAGINDLKREGEEKMLRGKSALQEFRLYRDALQTDSAKAAIHAQNMAKDVKYFGYGHIKNTDELVPPMPVVYWAFRIMVGLGSALLLVLLLFLWYQWKKKGEFPRWLLHAGLWSIPAVYIAGQAGWTVAEVGRQPWIIQDLMPVSVGISELPSSNVAITFFLFLIIFTVLLIAEIKIMCNVIKNYQAK
ncbi:MAG: cytochrome ubiquinol oxidase subunit I, partial [Alloprevotella sp.]|nr:cytochrome ubiquinol oxidase subunit I [Alloprevotella sp.]